jgi:hypothetical protein
LDDGAEFDEPHAPRIRISKVVNPDNANMRRTGPLKIENSDGNWYPTQQTTQRHAPYGVDLAIVEPVGL